MLNKGNLILILGRNKMNKNKELLLYLCSFAQRYWLYLRVLAVAGLFGALFKMFVNYQTREIISIFVQSPKNDVTGAILLFIFYQIMHHMVYFVSRLFDMKYKPLILAELIESMYIKTIDFFRNSRSSCNFVRRI